jgi:hypothetical protein
MNYVRMRTHADDPRIPEGKAVLEWDNNGFIGTSNGWPLQGMPALFPQSQAEAIMHCVLYVQTFHPQLDEVPHPECISPEAKNWITGLNCLDHTK